VLLRGEEKLRQIGVVNQERDSEPSQNFLEF
jgi:hypothetical protein